MFWKRFRLFKLLGFTVHIDATWVFLAFLITWSLSTGLFPFYYEGLSPETYWIMGVIGALGLFLSIVLHELSHSVVARKYGIPMTGITLFIFGGVAEMSEEPKNPKSEFLMAIAGPIASIALALGFWGTAMALEITSVPQPIVGVLNYLAAINGLLAAFNMIPAFPLDGGRVLRSILWARYNGIEKATRIASNIGSGFGIVLIGLGILFFLTGNLVGGIWWVLIGLFLRTASMSSYQQMQIRNYLEGEPVSNFMKTDLVTVDPSITIDDLVNDYFYRHHYKLFPVTKNGDLKGLVQLSDVKKIDPSKRKRLTVGEIMEETSAKNTVCENGDAMEGLKKMKSTNRSRLLVIRKDGSLAGILTLKDLLEFFSLKLDLEK